MILNVKLEVETLKIMKKLSFTSLYDESYSY